MELKQLIDKCTDAIYASAIDTGILDDWCCADVITDYGKISVNAWKCGDVEIIITHNEAGNERPCNNLCRFLASHIIVDWGEVRQLQKEAWQ